MSTSDGIAIAYSTFFPIFLSRYLRVLVLTKKKESIAKIVKVVLMSNACSDSTLHINVFTFYDEGAMMLFCKSHHFIFLLYTGEKNSVY